MQTGVQFTGTLQPNQTHSWFSWGWNPALHVVWYVMPTTPKSGAFCERLCLLNTTAFGRRRRRRKAYHSSV